MSSNFNLLSPDGKSLYNQGKDALPFLPAISSGYRSPGENAAAHGAPNSDHLTGNAFDIPTRGLSSDQQQQVLDYYRNNYSSSDVFVNDERNRAGHGPHIHISYRGEEGKAGDAKKDGTGNNAKGNDSKGGDNKDNAQQKDREDPTDKNKEIGKKTKPPEPTKHDDIQGSPGNYKQVKTSSIVGRLPTHEPWPYHPKSQLGPRQGIQRADPGNSNGTDSSSGGGGGSSGSSGSSSSPGSGTSTNPSGSNSANAGNTNPVNLDKSTDPQKAAAIQKAAAALGVDPTNLAAIISYESAGSMSPSIRGGRNKDGSGAGSFVGLIQFSPDNQRKYGVSGSQSFEDQLMNSVVPYMRDRGVKPGASLLQMYSSVNAGRAGDGDPNNPLYRRSDVNGNQLQHVQNIANGGHMKRAQRIMGSLSGGPPRGDNGMNPANANSAPSAPSSNSTSGSQAPTAAQGASGTDNSNSDSGTTTPNATDKTSGQTQGTGAVSTNSGNQGGDGSTSPGKPSIKVSLVGSGSGVATIPK